MEAKYVIVYTDGIEFDEAFDGPENVEHCGLHYIWREVIYVQYIRTKGMTELCRRFIVLRLKLGKGLFFIAEIGSDKNHFQNILQNI